MRPSYYAVAVGRERGIYSTWGQCKDQVNGYSGAIYKGFRSLNEARAFLDAHAAPSSSGGSGMYSKDEASAPIFSQHQPRGKPTRSFKVDDHDSEEDVAPTRPPIQRPRLDPSTSYSTNTNERQRPPPLSAPSSPSTYQRHHQNVYVDGACSHNGTANARAGYGGYYGSLNDARNFALPVPPSEAQTNNRGELRAVIHGIVQGFVDAGVPKAALEASHNVAPNWRASELSRPLPRLVIHTDSRYVIDGLTRYSQRWVTNGFKLATKEPVLNQDLWKQLIQLRDAYNNCYAQQQYEAARQHGTSVLQGSSLAVQPPKKFHAHNTYNDETEGIELRHVKGHSNDYGNEMADLLAVQGSRMHGAFSKR